MKYQLSAILTLMGILMQGDLKETYTAVTNTADNPPPALPTNLQSKLLPPPKQHNIALIMRGVYIFTIGNQQLLVVPEHYLADLTNIYRSYQVIPKLALDEP